MASSVRAPVVLSDAERAQLQSWTRRRTSAQALALRSRIVLLACDGLMNTEIAAELGIDRNTAAKWRSRFVEQRLDGRLDEPRPGRPRTMAHAGCAARGTNGWPAWRTPHRRAL